MFKGAHLQAAHAEGHVPVVIVMAPAGVQDLVVDHVIIVLVIVLLPIVVMRHIILLVVVPVHVAASPVGALAQGAVLMLRKRQMAGTDNGPQTSTCWARIAQVQASTQTLAPGCTACLSAGQITTEVFLYATWSASAMATGSTSLTVSM